MERRHLACNECEARKKDDSYNALRSDAQAGSLRSGEKRYNILMNERDIFDERQEIKKASFSCPSCRERNDYEVRWLTRRKKQQAPRHLNQDDRAKYEKSRDYMVRVDDQLMCKNIRCRKRFEIPSSQSVVFI